LAEGGAASHITDIVRLDRSPIPVWRKGDLLRVNMKNRGVRGEGVSTQWLPPPPPRGGPNVGGGLDPKSKVIS
jgi:hypothetical protein